MNKKGLLLSLSFWLVFIAIIAYLGITVMQGGAVAGVKGEWHINFLTKNYLEAEQKLLNYDSLIYNTAVNVAWEMAPNGGFIIENPSPCGKTSNGVSLWYKEGTLCLPPIEKALEKTKSLLQKKIPTKTYHNLEFDKTIFRGEGEKETISSDVGTYTFSTSFFIDWGYSYGEYNQLTGEAWQILLQCSGAEELQSCLDKNKPEHWKYSSCITPQFVQEKGVVIFCVESPKRYVLPVGEELYRPRELVTYNLALDLFYAFNPTQ
ncbi:MAG: hypothetical protein Q8Q01_03155 [archaeon]|nr:hypothetical protein [archaeon]